MKQFLPYALIFFLALHPKIHSSQISANQLNLYNQKLDHFNATDQRTFSQYFEFNDKYFKNGGPVFFYIPGLGPLSSTDLDIPLLKDLAKTNRGLLVALELRYYGQSFPFPEKSIDNYRFLTTKQILEDMKAFILWFSASHKLPPTTKWIAIGGSYAGNLVAWGRQKFPDIIFASIASSAPLKSAVDFFQYDLEVARILGEDCSNHLRTMMHYLEELVQDPSSFIKVKQMLSMENFEDPVGFLYALADFTSLVVQYDNPSHSFSVRKELCKLATISGNNQNRLEEFAKFSNHVLSSLKMKWELFNVLAINDLMYLNQAHAQQLKSWMYQSCTEMGHFQTAPNNSPLRSKLITVEWFKRAICQGIFNLPNSLPNINLINLEYGGTNICMERAIFTYGENDPWTFLGLQPNHVATNCQGIDMHVFTIPDVSHCSDLRLSPESKYLKQPLHEIKSIIGKWLHQSKIR